MLDFTGFARKFGPVLSFVRVAASPDAINQTRIGRRRDADHLAEAALGDAVFANVVMLGFSWQRGLVPAGLAALDRAIELNGVAVEANRRAFLLGRIAAAMPERLDAATHAELCHVLAMPADIRGYGPVKQEAARRIRAEMEALLPA